MCATGTAREGKGKTAAQTGAPARPTILGRGSLSSCRGKKEMSRRFRRVAIHEAGHVVAETRLGDGIAEAWVDPGYSGRTVSNSDLRSLVPPLGLLILLAGPFAEARYKKTTPVAAGGGRGDFAKAIILATDLEPDSARRHQLFVEVEREVRRFIRTPDVWQQIEAVADVLMRDGYIDQHHPLLIQPERVPQPLTHAVER
jgi:hypothetical protein